MNSDWDNGDDEFKVRRTRPVSLEQKRQRLIETARDNFEFDAQLEILEEKISKGTPFDDAVEQTLASEWDEEISDGTREQERENLRNLYRLVGELRKLDKSAVEERYRAHCRAAEDSERRLEEEKDKSEFFNCPGAQADISRWKRKKHWHPEEAVALSLGKNPKIVNPETLSQLRRPMSPFVSEFQARMNTLQRVISAGHISTPLARRAFIDWAVKEGFSLPSEFNATHRTDPSEEEAKDDEINPKTLHVFYCFLVGMAMKHYNFDPDYDPKQGHKSEVFSKMVHDLDGKLRVDVKTLRTHMNRAVEYARANDRIPKKVLGNTPK
jgi:hypothetical protein